MFFGTYIHKIDDKGRVAVPRAFRDELIRQQEQERCFATPSRNKRYQCIEVAPETVWKGRLKKLGEDDGVGYGNLSKARLHYASNSAQLEFDSQGRILIPPYLRERFRGSKEVAYTGDVDRFFLWSKPEWERVQAELEDEVTNEDFQKDLTSGQNQLAGEVSAQAGNQESLRAEGGSEASPS